ncbi:integrase/recombinase XerC [Collimonas sp. OK607]|uniref:tyrosine recombinase XerC n=1 Tax=Collimonas sp. OK607 TaxID=1798194 RepID=UPI0008E94066|nr:tyrosine recombinase XerC [Collimonas sp. OK607]SFA87452.1 integrase/recombinase XerC [Collimonas sp. OK607]
MNGDANQTHLSGYLDSLAGQRQLSAHTISNYARDLKELASLTQALGDSWEFAAVTHFHIRKFAAQLHSRGLNPSSIARKLSAWRGFFEWLAEQTTLATNPVEGVKAPKRAKPLPKAMAADDAIHLVASGNPLAEAGSSMALCNHAMFELLYSSGLRVSELAGLDLRYSKQAGYESAGWIDLDAAEVTVTGKGGKKRSVPVGNPAIQAITAWLPQRQTLLKNDQDDNGDKRDKDGHAAALFLTERGTRVSPRVIQLRLKHHALSLGIASNVHPHVLRHSFASHMLQGSGDLRAVQELLGHASIAATQVYTSLDFQRLAQVYDAAHPRAKKISDT